MAYWQIEPWGEDRHELRNGVLCSWLYELNKSKGAALIPPSKFMRDFVEDRQQSEDEQWLALKHILGARKTK